MARVIQSLENEPVSKMKKVLSNASKGLVPIEIDGTVYYIHNVVQDLIDSIYVQSISRSMKKN